MLLGPKSVCNIILDKFCLICVSFNSRVCLCVCFYASLYPPLCLLVPVTPVTPGTLLWLPPSLPPRPTCLDKRTHLV
jgi:hypothetical protein